LQLCDIDGQYPIGHGVTCHDRGFLKGFPNGQASPGIIVPFEVLIAAR